MFRNNELYEKFKNDGYVVLDLFSQENIALLKKIYSEHQPEKKDLFEVSTFSNNANDNRAIDTKLKSVFMPALDKHFHDYKPLQGLFYIKYPGKKSRFHFHKDWSIVDESQFTSMHIWAPLTDTTKENGCLRVCQNDYHKRLSYRGSPGFEYPAPTIIDKVLYRLTYKDIPLKKGQAICFDHKLTHGSGPNDSAETRVACGISIMPAASQLIHYHLITGNSIQQYVMPEDFYLDFRAEKFESDYTPYLAKTIQPNA